MSQINNVGTPAPVQQVVTPAVQKNLSTAPAVGTRAADRLELSGASHLLQTLKTNDVRTAKVAEIRAQIEAGTYETDDKLHSATDKLLDDLLK